MSEPHRPLRTGIVPEILVDCDAAPAFHTAASGAEELMHQFFGTNPWTGGPVGGATV
ncbi:MAG: hypothetical protein QF653_04235 [Acidimicrobiales bacterium]|jgi:hypothetical protein|nr:hypothetical protein [Acidimicrobiales bacterium]